MVLVKTLVVGEAPLFWLHWWTEIFSWTGPDQQAGALEHSCAGPATAGPHHFPWKFTFPGNSKSAWSFSEVSRGGICELLLGKPEALPLPNQSVSLYPQVRHCLSFTPQSPPTRLFSHSTFLGSGSLVSSSPHPTPNKQKSKIRSLTYIWKVQKSKFCGFLVVVIFN